MKWQKTKAPGVRYREHATRKHGIQKDWYFAIYYQANGKRKEEGLGWASQGWTLEKAVYELSRIKKAQRTGEWPQTLAEKRKIENERREAEQIKQERHEKESVTFGQFFENTYRAILETSKKPGSVKAERILFEKWIKPVVGERAFRDIFPLHVEKIKQDMLKEGKTPRSIEYTLAVVRQVWNMAQRDGLIDRDSPTREVKKPKVDNRRLRFLTHEEADRLLENLAPRSLQLHDMALLSLHTGMSAGEIFSLKWGSLDVEQGLIYIIDAKGGSRTGHMTEAVKEIFQNLEPGGPDELMFKDRRHGGRIKQMSSSFDRAVDALGLNKGITDPRQKVLFHTLRHTFASWLVQQGEPLYIVQKLMGHASIAMTERYSHLAPDTLKAAVRNFENGLTKNRQSWPVALNKK